MSSGSTKRKSARLNLSPWQQELLFVAFGISVVGHAVWLQPNWFTVGLLGLLSLVAVVHLGAGLLRTVRRKERADLKGMADPPPG